MRHNGSGGHDPAEGMAHEDNELIQASLGDSGGGCLVHGSRNLRRPAPLAVQVF